jgi:general secretion pathway protein K
VIVKMARPSRARKRAGFALLAVIWGTGLIAMLVVAFMTNGRLRLQGAQNIARAAAAAYVADSAINLSTLSLLSKRDAVPTGGEETVSNGDPKFCVLDRAAVALAIEDESGKVDINAASPELLGAALQGFGVDPGRAKDISAAIVAFRSPPQGGVRTLGTTADKPFEPKQALFETALELDQVSGIDPDLYRALLPFVTVYSRTPGVDPRASPPALFAALAGFPVEDVRSLIALPYPNRLNRTDPRFPASFNQQGDHGAYLIHAEVLLESGQTATKEAVLDLRPPNGRQFAFREVRGGQSRYVTRLRAIIASNGAGVPDC